MNDQQRAAMQMALETAEDIVKADWKTWEELASPKEFVRWAKSRANHMATALREALQEHALQTLSDIHQQIEQPQGEWVDLTDDEVVALEREVGCFAIGQLGAIIAKFKEKNTPPVVPQGEPVACEPVPPIYEDGWSDWICPKPKGYLMQCCDCGLIHEVDSRVAKYEPRPSEEFVVVNDQNMQSQWRMRRRDDLASSQQAERMIFQAREIGESEWFDVGLDETERINAYINSPHIDYRRLYAAPVSIEAAVLAEREACAKVCEELGYFHEVPQGSDLAFELAAAIRSME